MKKAVFLDRDGVINNTYLKDGKQRAPRKVEDFRFLDGVEEAAQALHKAGFLLIVVTNQPDVARGWQSLENVEAMNEIVKAVLKVHDLWVCYHIDEDSCHCRKPLPGMLLEAAAKYDIDLKNSFMVGDRPSDIQAGKAAGCTTLLIGDGYGEPAPVFPDQCVSSLREAADWILKRLEARHPL